MSQPSAKILLFCQVFHPDPQSTSQLFSLLVPRLAAHGGRFEVICGFPAGASVPAKEDWNGIRIRRVGGKDRSRQGIMARLLAYLTFLGGTLRILNRTDAGNTTVVACTNPPLLPILVSLLPRFRGRHHLILQDLYPEGLEGTGVLRRGGVLANLWRRLNRGAYARARTITVLGRDMRARLMEEYGLPAEQVRWIPHWSPAGQRNPLSFSQSRLIQRLGLKNKWVVQYSGNMGLWHDMETLVRAADLLREEENIHFIFAGSGRRRSGAEQMSRRLELRNITWIDPVPLKELDDLLAGCHAALISQRKGLTGIAVPCKLYGILASGRPVLAAVPPESETALVVREEKCGEVVCPHDPQALADCLRRWSRDPSLTEEMGKKSIQAYEQKYTLEQAVGRFREAWQI